MVHPRAAQPEPSEESRDLEEEHEINRHNDTTNKMLKRNQKQSKVGIWFSRGEIPPSIQDAKT